MLPHLPNRMIRFSRGRDIHDNAPRQIEVHDFAAFVAALDADRAPTKAGAGFVCGPLNGNGRRSAEGAEPRRWLAVDLDRIAADRLPDVRMWFARFSGCAWPTHSSKPEAPRERAVLELDRDATRDECSAIGRALAHSMLAEFGDAVLVDPSTFRPEQPVFVPPSDATLARFFGEPLAVDAYLEAARKLPTDAPERPTGDDRDGDDLLGRLDRGDALHEVLLTLVARLAAKGVAADIIRAAAVGLLERARRARGNRVDDLARDELRRMIDGALSKYAPAEGPQPVDIFRAIVAPLLDPQDFPPVLRDFAAPLAAAAGHDPAAYLMAALGAAAAAISDSLRLQIDPRTSWFDSARLWVLLLGAPGTAKTPAIRAAMAPLFDLHRQQRDDHARACAALDPDDPKPALPAVFVNDATIEKLSEVLADNPRGIVAVFEELDTWLGAHDCYRGGQGSKDRGEWLRLFDGGPHQVDRIKRGSYFVHNWGASILGATTPAGLRRHAKDLPPDGLIQRFLPVLVRPMSAPDERIQGADIKRARDAFESTLLALFAVPGGTVRLSPQAAAIFFARRDALRAECAAVTSMSEPFAGHVAKGAGLLARVALTFHCLERGKHAADAELSGETMARAAALLRKLTRHALAMFDMLAGNDGTVALARAVGRAIVAGTLPALTRRDLIHGCRAFRDAPEWARESALRYLVDAGWLTPVDEGRQYAGRAAGFAVTPEIHARFAAEGAAIRQRRATVRDMLGG